MLSILSAIQSLANTENQFNKYIMTKYQIQAAHIRLLDQMINGSANLTDLVNETGLDYSTISRQIAAMQKVNLVTVSTLSDKRVKKVELTQIGKEKEQQIELERLALEEKLLVNWPEEEKQLLLVLMNRCLRSFQRLDFKTNSDLDRLK